MGIKGKGSVGTDYWETETVNPLERTGCHRTYEPPGLTFKGLSFRPQCMYEFQIATVPSTIRRCTHRCNLTHAHKNSTDLPAPIFFTKLAGAQEHYGQISCTEFHPDRTINVEITERNACTLLSKVCPLLRRLAGNAKVLSSFLFTFPVPIFIQIG